MPDSSKQFLQRFTEEIPQREQAKPDFLGGEEHRIPGADMINQSPDVDYYHMPVFEYNPQPDAEIMAYSPQEKAEDKMLLRSLQRGEMGSGRNIDKAIQDLINKINGVSIRGV